MNIISRITKVLMQAIKKTGTASLVVSGGTSPLAIFNKLSVCDVNWDKVFISLVDDRMVEPKNKESNEALLRKHLLINKASIATFIPLKELSNYPNLINEPFDVVLLGMGQDGHFASLFPDMIKSNIKAEVEAFNINSKPLIFKTLPIGNPKLSRITMNLPMILDSNLIILIVNGKVKKLVFDKALDNKLLPIHYLLAQKKKKIFVEKLF